MASATSSPSRPHRRLRRWRRLRLRLIAAFAASGLLFATGVSLLTYESTKRYLVSQRQASAVRQARANARLVRSLLASPGPDVPRLLGSLETPATSRSVVYHDGQWFATTAVVGRDSLPTQLRADVIVDRKAARQRYHQGGTVVVAVGIPLQGRDGYFEVFSLADLERAIATLRISLLAASGLMFALCVGMGVWASSRVLRPVTDIGAAAKAIAGGRLDARLDAAGDEELAALAAGFNAMVDSLQSRIERDAHFASDVSHELRSPLTSLRSAVEAMERRRDRLDERSRQALDLVADEVHRFQRLLEDLLEISRYDAGVARLALEDVDIEDLVVAVLARCGQPRCPVTVDGTPTTVVADRRRIERSVQNLADNTLAYAGGVTAVTIEAVDGNVRIAVEDQGPGISATERDVIFGRFARGAHAGNRSSNDGTGLGLALVSEHMRLHHGRAWVEERDAGAPGARFVLEFPADLQ